MGGVTRIISGFAGSLRLAVPPVGTRPTSDRVREAIFSALDARGVLPGARVLDLYAGSGALGFEALSRGARSVDFVESHAVSLRTIEANARLLGATDYAIHRADVERFVAGLEAEAYDLAFADPPYAQGRAESLAAAWLETPFARVLGIEHESRVTMPAGGDTRRYGTTSITLYRLPDA